MSNLNAFKAELRGRVEDYATTFQLVSGGALKTQKEKDSLNDKSYEKLEQWILEQCSGWSMDMDKISVKLEVDPEDTTLQLDF